MASAPVRLAAPLAPSWRGLWFLGLCGAGALTFVLAARLFGVRELDQLKRALQRRTKRAT